ncbi:MAG: Wzy polymerase domain-containing protein [Janthinobacterium lividum]
MPTLSSRNTSIFLFALLVLAWTVPYAVVAHTYPVPTFYAEYVAYGLFVLIGATVGVLTAGTPTLRRAASPRVAIVPLAFAAVLVLQTLVLPTEQPSMNLLGAGSLLIAALVVHAGYWTSRLQLGEEALRWIAWGLIAGGLFALFCQVVQLCHAEARFAPFVVSYGVLADRRPFGNMAQANHLATYIAFAFAAAVYLVQTRRLPLFLWVVLAALYSLGLALTVSRTPWLQTAVIFVVSLAMAWSDGRTAMLVRGWQKGRRWLVPVLTVLIFCAMNVLVRRLNLSLGLHLAESAADRFKDAGQISPRLALWDYGWTMFKTHPWLGVGWGEFPRFQYQLVQQLGRVEIANNSHDIVIDVLAKTGLIGAGIVALGLGFWIWRVLRASCSAARLFALGLLAILAVHTLVEYPQQYLFFLLPAAFLIGVLETESMVRMPTRITAIGYAGVTLAGILMAYPVLADYHRAEKLYYGNRPEQEYRAAPSTIFGAWGEFGLSTLLQLDSNGLANKLAMHRKALALLPGEVVLRRYAVLRALDGDTPGALDQVARLKIFAEALHDWPAQLGLLYKLCETRPALDDFKAQLNARYGVPGPGLAAHPEDDDDDDEGDGD